MAKCRICGYRWEPRRKEPKACPRCKRYDWKEAVKVSIIILFSIVLFPNLARAASWTTLTQSDFNLGTYFNTTYNTTGSFAMLNNTTTVVYSPFGNYSSKIFDASTAVQWNNISWIEGVPYGEELPDNQLDRSATVLGEANMTGNVLLLHMNEGSGTTAIDSSGNGNNGTLNSNVTWTTGRFGNAINNTYSSAGLGDKRLGVNISTANLNSYNFTGYQNFTVSAWVNYANLSSSNTRIIAYENSTESTNRDQYALYLITSGSAGAFRISVINATGTQSIAGTGTGIANPNTWYFVAGVYNGTHVILYINGTRNDNSIVVGGIGITYGSPGLFIGRGLLGDSSVSFNGTIDEVAIWNRSLSATEILNLYKRGALRLNITTKSCDDSACSGENWNQTRTNATSSNIMEQNNRYFQYKANFETDRTSYTPELYNVTINYTPIPFTISTNATTAKRGDFLNITISSALTPTANMTSPNGAVVWLTTPVPKGNNMYETNYTFLNTDPSGSYRIGANSSTDSNTTNITMSFTISVTLESDKMSATRKISTRSSNYILAYGTTNYDEDGSACSGCTVSFTYDNDLAGSNTTNSVGSYNFTFSIPSDGNYSFKVQATDNYGNSGNNATIMSIKTRPEYVKFRLSYALGTTKTNDVYKIGTAGNVSGLIDSADLSILQYSSNLTHGYVCTYDNTEYSNGLSISLIHSYKSSYLDYVNFSASSSSTNYTLELRNKIDGSNLLLTYTKGTCDNIDSKMYLVEKQNLPSTSFSTFSYGGPSQYPYEIRTDYDRIQINGSSRWSSGSFKLCIQKTGVSSANKPIVDVGTC
jgi:hypothetical protein